MSDEHDDNANSGTGPTGGAPANSDALHPGRNTDVNGNLKSDTPSVTDQSAAHSMSGVGGGEGSSGNDPASVGMHPVSTTVVGSGPSPEDVLPEPHPLMGSGEGSGGSNSVLPGADPLAAGPAPTGSGGSPVNDGQSPFGGTAPMPHKTETDEHEDEPNDTALHDEQGHPDGESHASQEQAGHDDHSDDEHHADEHHVDEHHEDGESHAAPEQTQQASVDGEGEGPSESDCAKYIHEHEHKDEPHCEDKPVEDHHDLPEQPVAHDEHHDDEHHDDEHHDDEHHDDEHTDVHAADEHSTEPQGEDENSATNKLAAGEGQHASSPSHPGNPSYDDTIGHMNAGAHDGNLSGPYDAHHGLDTGERDVGEQPEDEPKNDDGTAVHPDGSSKASMAAPLRRGQGGSNMTGGHNGTLPTVPMRGEGGAGGGPHGATRLPEISEGGADLGDGEKGGMAKTIGGTTLDGPPSPSGTMSAAGAVANTTTAGYPHLVVNFSEDAVVGGDAEVTIMINGRPVLGTVKISSHHGVCVQGISLGPINPDVDNEVAISFTNTLHSGSLNRVLYVESYHLGTDDLVKLDEMMKDNGTFKFTVQAKAK